MRNHAVLCDYPDFDRSYPYDSYTKTFPVYKHLVTKLEFIPGNPYPSKCFSIKSYHVAVKSQQWGNESSLKDCIDPKQPKPVCCCCNKRSFNPSDGFRLIEYADKCCSEIKLEPKEEPSLPLEQSIMSPTPEEVELSSKQEVESLPSKGVELPVEKEIALPSGRKCPCKGRLSKALVDDRCKCCDKSVNCELSTVCLPPPCKPSCLKTKSSGVNVHNKPSCLDKKSSSKEIILCKKCKEKRNKAKHEKCHCKSGSVVYYQRRCNCIKDKHDQQYMEESFSKFECNKYKCKYLDLIQRIKCYFTKET